MAHKYDRAECDNCGQFWPLDSDDTPIQHDSTAPEVKPLDGDWYARLDEDGIVPVGICGVCDALVYLQPSRWVPRPAPTAAAQGIARTLAARPRKPTKAELAQADRDEHEARNRRRY